jgi:hypothetical protein
MKDIFDIKDDVMDWCIRIIFVSGSISIFLMVIGFMSDVEIIKEIGSYLEATAMITSYIWILLLML